MQRTGVSSSPLLDLKKKIKTLEEAIKETENTKSKLQKNVQEVKAEIRTVVSRHLESLRNREVWLLEQVDLIKTLREDSLSQHTDSLYQALGHLQGCLELSASQGPGCQDSPQHWVHQLHQAVNSCLRRFEELELEGGEGECIAFKVKPALKEEIQQFGRVETQGVPSMEMVFAAPGSHASSLPQAFEEYDDEEHHVLYKTLEGSGGVTIQFGPTKPKALPKNWLFLPPDEKLEPISGNEPLQPPFQEDLDQWLARQNVRPSTSIHQWLRGLHGEGEEEGGYTEIEPDSDSIVSLNPPEGVSQQPAPPVRGSEPVRGSVRGSVSAVRGSVSAAAFPYFQQIHTDSTQTWLYTGQRTSVDQPISSPYKVMSYFREVSNDTRDWLKKYDQKQKDEDQDDCCCGGSKCSLPRRPTQSMDIENLDQLICPPLDEDEKPATGQYFSKVKQSQPNIWLSPAMGQKAKEVSDVCRANETCQTFSECLCEENCGKRGGSDVKTMPTTTKAVIPPGVASDKNGKDDMNYWLASKVKDMVVKEQPPSPTDAYFRQVKCSTLGWLKESGTSLKPKKEVPKPSTESPFSRIPECKSSDWLSSRSGSIDADTDDAANWLAPESPKKRMSSVDPSDIKLWLKMEDPRKENQSNKDHLKKWLQVQHQSMDTDDRKTMWATDDLRGDFSPFSKNTNMSCWLAGAKDGSLKRTLSKEEELPESEDDNIWLSKGNPESKLQKSPWLTKGEVDKVTANLMVNNLSDWLLHDD